jgi:hypothetical protein
VRVEGYRELKELEKQQAATPLAGEARMRLEQLRDRDTRGQFEQLHHGA